MKEPNHVFIFGVGGRCSSTALQRILNSSNQICIWGEQHFLIDEIINIIEKVNYFINDPIVVKDTNILRKCIQGNNHLFPGYPYMHAMGNLENLKSVLSQSIYEHFKPPENIKRFGFKDIRINSVQTLTGLKKLFPNCQFIFLFRNPMVQWLSVNHYKYWEYSHNIDDFLEEYFQISSILLKYHKHHNNSIFMENTSMDNDEVFNNVLSFLNIQKVDREVKNKKYLTQEIQNKGIENTSKIKSHSAFKNFIKMRDIQI